MNNQFMDALSLAFHIVLDSPFTGFFIGLFVILSLVRLFWTAMEITKIPNEYFPAKQVFTDTENCPKNQETEDRNYAALEASRAERVRRHEEKQRAHKCEYCGATFKPNKFGGCFNCGAPRE